MDEHRHFASRPRRLRQQSAHDLHQCGKFAGLSRAVLLPEQAELGEVAVNTAAIATVAEAKVE